MNKKYSRPFDAKRTTHASNLKKNEQNIHKKIFVHIKKNHMNKNQLNCFIIFGECETCL